MAKPRPGQDPGSDPDLVSSGQLPDQALKAVGVQPGTKHEGSVRPLLEGKEDIEVAGVALTKEQVNTTAVRQAERFCYSKQELTMSTSVAATQCNFCRAEVATSKSHV